MLASLLALGVPWWQLVVRSLVIYLVFVLVLRVFGKREVGQFTLTDLILILLVANAVQPAMTGPDSSLLGGLVIVATLFLANLVLSYLRVRFRPVRMLLEGEPAVIGRDGRWLPGPMRREGVDMDEAQMALREHGVADIKDAALVVLEVDGTISVVPEDAGAVHRGRRRVRYLKRG